ncbi:hypothetical protein E3N88_38804 [Mikania micrantha]|uniref:Uncharacterized protein n=1 Tax=Mikania micrantha TaxID=192012 RepID=A0A5N6LV52_9ASTR|nr:hypothetical protein E3N88_38804 [Mikania micrantha]
MKVDSSRYAMVPRQEASQYAKQTGSRDSRITSLYAMMNFDRPPRCLLAGASFRRREHTKTGNCTTRKGRDFSGCDTVRMEAVIRMEDPFSVTFPCGLLIRPWAESPHSSSRS